MKNILNDIATFSTQLQDILKQEFDVLNQQNFEKLMQLTSQKQQLLSQLEALEKERQRLCDGHASFRDYLQQLPGGESLKKQWSQLRQQLQDCREQNEINGRLLQKKQQLSADMLALLSGNKETSPATYEADGSQQKPGSILGNTQA